MRQKKSCQVGFIVKATICFMDSDPIRFIIHFIICSKIWIIRIFWFSNAPCSQFIGIMWGSHLSNCLSKLIDLLHLTFGVFMQLCTNRSKGLLQNFSQSNEHCFIAFDDIASCERISGGISWLAIRGNSSFSWILFVGHDWCGFCRQVYYLSWAAVKTSCQFTGKAVKRIFCDFSGIHPPWWHDRLHNEIDVV